jgi:organic radical activating enzyme
MDRLSIELTNQCRKACWFCYSASTPQGSTCWTANEIVDFATDCARHGVRAVSFGGGEPLEHPGIFDVLRRLRGALFRSLTTNGLMLLEDGAVDELVDAQPNKVHVSIHFANDAERVIQQVHRLAERGIQSGVNLLVPRSQLATMTAVAKMVRAAGIGNDRIVYLPMRIEDTPTPDEIGRVAGGERFQSMTCLSACGRSPRFCSIGWDKTVAWCSYTKTRRALKALTYEGLLSALDNLGLEFCGGSDDGPLVRLSRRPLDGHGLVRGRS